MSRTGPPQTHSEEPLENADDHSHVSPAQAAPSDAVAPPKSVSVPDADLPASATPVQVNVQQPPAFWQNLFSACLVLTAIVALYISNNQWQTAQDGIDLVREQISVNQDPVIALPTGFVHGKVGEFTIPIRNTGVSAVADIEVYKDYYVVSKPPIGRLTFHQFGNVFVTSKPVIEQLTPNQAADLEITFTETYQRMSAFYVSEGLKGARMRVLRLRLRYRRTVDGKAFSTARLYIIAGDGSALISHTNQEQPTMPGTITYSELQAALGLPPG